MVLYSISSGKCFSYMMLACRQRHASSHLSLSSSCFHSFNLSFSRPPSHSFSLSPLTLPLPLLSPPPLSLSLSIDTHQDRSHCIEIPYQPGLCCSGRPSPRCTFVMIPDSPIPLPNFPPSWVHPMHCHRFRPVCMPPSCMSQQQQRDGSNRQFPRRQHNAVRRRIPIPCTCRSARPRAGLVRRLRHRWPCCVPPGSYMRFDLPAVTAHPRTAMRVCGIWDRCRSTLPRQC
jgi:hypothetical protein